MRTGIFPTYENRYPGFFPHMRTGNFPTYENRYSHREESLLSLNHDSARGHRSSSTSALTSDGPESVVSPAPAIRLRNDPLCRDTAPLSPHTILLICSPTYHAAQLRLITFHSQYSLHMWQSTPEHSSTDQILFRSVLFTGPLCSLPVGTSQRALHRFSSVPEDFFAFRLRR